MATASMAEINIDDQPIKLYQSTLLDVNNDFSKQHMEIEFATLIGTEQNKL